MAGKLVLIIGPSGVGKSVILKELRRRHGSARLTTGPEFHFPRSATTRPRRDGESDDLYRFVTDAEFDQLLKKTPAGWEFVKSDASIDLTDSAQEYRLGRLTIFS